jgi:hypothetical protein
MIWFLGLVAALAAGVVLLNVLLKTAPPRRKNRPPLVWHASRRAFPGTQRSQPAAVGSSTTSSDGDYVYLLNAPSYSAHDPSPACDPGPDTPDSDGCDFND